MNIVFDHRPSYQEPQSYVINNPAKASQRKSPSTLRRDKQRSENYMKKWDNQASGPHGLKIKQQLRDSALNFNVNAPEFKPATSPVKFPKSDGKIDYEVPYSACDNSEFLELTDNTNVLKHELKQTKVHLDHVSKELKSLKESNATQNRCNVELITHVAEVTLELKETKEKMTDMKRQEDLFMKQIRDMGTELEKAQSDLRTVIRSSQQRDEGYDSLRHYEQRNTRDYKLGHKGYRNYQDSDYHKDRYIYYWNSFQSNVTWTI